MMQDSYLSYFGITMLGTSLSFSACLRHNPPKPLPERTAADVALALDISADVAEIIAGAVAEQTTREGCIVSRVAAPALRSAAVGVRAGATDAPVIPALTIDLTPCGDAEQYPISDDAAPWLTLWSSVANLVQRQLDAGTAPESCAARVVSSAVLGYVAEDLTTEVAAELIESTADGMVIIGEQSIGLAACGG